MKLLKYLGGLLIAMFLLSPTTAAIANITGLSPVAATVLVMAAAFYSAYKVPSIPGLYTCDPIQKELFRSDIVENLFKDNSFALRSRNMDAFVLGGTVVHAPVAGAPQRGKKNLTEFPQTATVRQDSKQTYALDAIYILPRRIPNLDRYQYTYDSRVSVLGGDIKQHTQDCMEALIWHWSPSTTAGIYRTTGAATAATLTGATGNRKKFTKDIFRAMTFRFNKKEILKTGRVALLTSDHLQQLWDDFTEVELTSVFRYADATNGIIGRFMGWDIMERSTVSRYASNASVDELDEGYAAGVTDCAGSLFYQEDCVERAVGTIDIFDNPGQALYYGDVFSAMSMIGGNIRRADGVCAVVEAPTT